MRLKSTQMTFKQAYSVVFKAGKKYFQIKFLQKCDCKHELNGIMKEPKQNETRVHMKQIQICLVVFNQDHGKHYIFQLVRFGFQFI